MRVLALTLALLAGAADLIVLYRNLFRAPVDRISGTKVLMTMLGGRVVHGDLELRR